MEKQQTIDELRSEIYAIMYGIKKSFWAKKEYVFVAKCLDKTWKRLVASINIGAGKGFAKQIKTILLEISTLELTTQSITILYKDISKCKSAQECSIIIAALPILIKSQLRDMVDLKLNLEQGIKLTYKI